MGFEVERAYARHEKNFARLKAYETDMLTSAWLPSSHGGYKEDVEKVRPVIDLGLHYEPYALWGVPDYVPAGEVSEVSDLLKPQVIEKMTSHIQGINPGAGITRFSIKMMEEYGLSDAGYTFSPGTEEACFTAFEEAVANKQWIIVPLWKPQFLHYKYKIREIMEPKGLLGVVDQAVLIVPEDKKTLFTKEQLDTLDSLRFNNEIIAELDYKICRENRPIDQVTKEWLDKNWKK